MQIILLGSFNAAAFLVKHMKEFCHLIPHENGIFNYSSKKKGITVFCTAIKVKFSYVF